jgi:hypothetical protein
MNEDMRSTVEPGFIHRRVKFPLLEREDRVALAERVNQSTPAGVDFIVMMTLASLGLMQGATAVVIGATLVAPLMGPLLGAGLDWHRIARVDRRRSSPPRVRAFLGDRPLSYPVSPIVRNAMKTYLEDHPGIEIITLARVAHEVRPAGVGCPTPPVLALTLSTSYALRAHDRPARQVFRRGEDQ